MNYEIINKVRTARTNTKRINSSIDTVTKKPSVITQMDALIANNATELTAGNVITIAKFIKIFKNDFKSVAYLKTIGANKKNCDEKHIRFNILKAYVEVAKNLEHSGLSVKQKNYGANFQIISSADTLKRLGGSSKASRSSSPFQGRVSHDLARISVILN